jgi:hypothetical protein
MHDHSLSLPCRFNLSFRERPYDIDGSQVDTDENGRPCFSSIAKDAGFLDKELAASGFLLEGYGQVYFEVLYG